MNGDSVLLIQLQRSSGEWIDVGHLHSRNQNNWFEISDSYWDLPDRPVLGQIFEEHGRTWRPNAHVALPHWFSHLLPEGSLRDAVAVASQIKPSREFELLGRLGATDLPGAVRALPMPWVATDSPLPRGTEEEFQDGNPLLKFSLAGVQLKFSVYGEGRGLTVPGRHQAGNYVLKFPDGRPGFDGVPEAELGCLELARWSGITAPEGHLVSPASVRGLEEWAAKVNTPALAVKRFDRKAGDQRVHMEEIAQVMDIPTGRGTAKYSRANFETIGVIVAALCGPATVAAVIDRIVLNVLVGNGDAHLKNWAVLYPDGVRPALSPVYDVVPTVLFISSDDLGLNLARSKSFEAVTPESFDSLGRRSEFGVSAARHQAREATERILTNWHALSAYLDATRFRRLTDRLQTLKLVGTSTTG